MRKVRKERSRASNIPFRNQAKMRGVVVNDIAIAMKGGAQVSQVPVYYSEDMVLNRPSIELEGIPTKNHKANSEMQAMQDAFEEQFATAQETGNEEVKQVNDKQDGSNEKKSAENI